jgi:hypothetical protein
MNPRTDWIDSARRLVETLTSGDAVPGAPPVEGVHAADCRWCPVCQVAAVVRGERPEVTAALADVLTASATALRTFAAGGDQAAPPAADASAAEAYPSPPVQRIDIA